MLDIGKLILGYVLYIFATGFSSMLDIGKLIHFRHDITTPPSFSSMLDIGKLILMIDGDEGTCVLAQCWI